MLEKVRNSLQSGFTYVLVAGLTVIFMFFFGMPTQTCEGGAGRTRALLANVDGQQIHTEDVNLIYNRIFGTDRSDEEAQYQQRRASSLRNLVLIKLFADRARAEGLRVSDDELKDYIKDPTRNVEFRYSYGREGSFNGHYYKAYVQNQLRASLDEYEEFKREELLARKYLAAHAAQVSVPSAELDLADEIKNTQINLGFVELDSEALRDSVEVSDEKLQSFLEDESDRIEKYYEDNKSEKYSEPAEMLVRRVYIPRPGPSAEDAKRQEADQKWSEAKRRVRDEGEQLGAVAAELGEQYPGKQKGLMPWSTSEDMNQKVRETLEGAEVGDIEEVVTEDAYKLVKLEDRNEQKTTPLEEVREEIARQLIREDRVGQLLEEAKSSLLTEARNTGSLQKALESLQSESDDPVWSDLTVQETGTFTLETQGPPPQLAGQLGGNLSGFGTWFDIPKIGSSKELAVVAYKDLSEQNPIPETTYEVDGSTYLVELKSRSKDDAAGEEETGGDDSFEYQLADKKLNEMLGRWTALFGSWNGQLVPPLQDYGPWIERQFKEAADEGSVTIYAKNSPVSRIVDQSLQPGGSAAPPGTPGSKKKKKGKGGPINLKMGGDGEKGKKIDLKDLKKKLKQKADDSKESE